VSPSVAPVIFDLIARGEQGGAGPRRDSGPDALTEREREVMGFIGRGRSNRDIAEELVISEKTVKNHIRAIYDKLGVANRAEAMAVWLGTEREERRG
jgi:DNA-binding NarL/FixJ family response regulator